VGLGRLELPTSPLSGVRSSHLSYRPGLCGNIPAPTTKAEHSMPARQPGPKSKLTDRHLVLEFGFEDKIERAAGLSPA
jgi:hypothetical protein